MPIHLARPLLLLLAFQFCGVTGWGQEQEAAGVRRARGGMVVSAYPEASRAGQAVLEQGGNAVDAAIATGLALAVTHPAAGEHWRGGLHGAPLSGWPVDNLQFPGESPAAGASRNVSGRCREVFPRAASSQSSGGRCPRHCCRVCPRPCPLWNRRLEAAPPAGRGASGSGLCHQSSAGCFTPGNAARVPEIPGHAGSVFRDGEPYQPGEKLVQSDLARTLERIRDHGHAGFYAGETAQLLVQEMERHGGWITLEDLQRYQAVEQPPVYGAYRGYDIISMSPPSSGGIALLQMLNILEGYDLASYGKESPQTLHLMAEAMRRAYRDRARWLADPAFATVPVAQLTSKGYAAELRQGIQSRQAGVSSPADLQLPAESEQTTHYSVVDGAGMAVAVTYTLEYSYGSYITVPGAGFLLNNEMGDFNPQLGLTTSSGLIGTEPNLARPEQRMLSSMTPTIIARDGKLVAVLGSPGGRTIINTVLNLVVNTIDFEMSPAAAVAAPRSHHQWLPDTLLLEGTLSDTPAAAELQQWGHRVQRRNQQGVAHVIFVDAEGLLVGVPDPRDRDGTAAGVAVTGE